MWQVISRRLRRSKGRDSKAAPLLNLSTIAEAEISNPPWVKFQSAGWVNFPSAPTVLLPLNMRAEAESAHNNQNHRLRLIEPPTISWTLRKFPGSRLPSLTTFLHSLGRFLPVVSGSSRPSAAPARHAYLWRHELFGHQRGNPVDADNLPAPDHFEMSGLDD